MYKKENPMKASGLYTKIFINHLFICHGINRLKRVLNKVKNFFYFFCNYGIGSKQ